MEVDYKTKGLGGGLEEEGPGGKNEWTVSEWLPSERICSNSFHMREGAKTIIKKFKECTSLADLGPGPAPCPGDWGSP